MSRGHGGPSGAAGCLHAELAAKIPQPGQREAAAPHGRGLGAEGFDALAGGLFTIWPWGITYGSIWVNEHPFATYFDVHQENRVLTHRHMS